MLANHPRNYLVAMFVSLLPLHCTEAQTVFASSYRGNQIVSIDLATGTVSPFASMNGLDRPDGLAVTRNGDVLVANYNGRVLRFDAQGTAQGVFCQPGGNVQDIVIGRGDEVLTVSWQSNAVRRYDSSGASLGVFGTATGLVNPVGMAFDADGNLLVQGLNSGNVVRLNGQTGAFIDTIIPNGRGGMTRCEGLAIGPDNNIYVGSTTQSAILRFERGTGRFIDIFAQAPSGEAPQAIWFGPDHHVYLSCFSGIVYRFDAETGAGRTTVTTVSGNLSHGLVSPDTDGDGLWNDWESNGIPYTDSNGQPQRYLLPGASALRKDIYVEVDAMSGRVPLSDTSLAARINGTGFLTPTNTVLDRVVVAFLDSPVPAPTGVPGGLPGVALHVILDETSLIPKPYPNGFTEFDVDKAAHFGRDTIHERRNANWLVIKEAKRKAYRYCIFGDSNGAGSSGGLAESGAGSSCNDFMVTLGRWTTPGGDADQQAGTFMHELGHTLGLGHGGGDDINFKPNYYSIMNYLWQLPTSYLPIRPVVGWSLHYADTMPLATLNEAMLSESAGIGGNVVGLMVPFTVPVASGSCTSTSCVRYAAFSGPVDWDNSGQSPAGTVAVNVNNFDGMFDLSGVPANQLLKGHNDWANLRYDFKGSPTYADGAPRPNQPIELDLSVYQFLNSLPPPPRICLADFNGDGFIDFFDYADYVGCFETGLCGGGSADFNGDGFVDFFDYGDFVTAFETGC